MISQAFLVGFAGLAYGFPSMMEEVSSLELTLEPATPTITEAIKSNIKQAQKLQDRGLLSGTLGIITGELGSILASVDPDNLRPEPG